MKRRRVWWHCSGGGFLGPAHEGSAVKLLFSEQVLRRILWIAPSKCEGPSWLLAGEMTILGAMKMMMMMMVMMFLVMVPLSRGETHWWGGDALKNKKSSFHQKAHFQNFFWWKRSLSWRSGGTQRNSNWRSGGTQRNSNWRMISWNWMGIRGDLDWRGAPRNSSLLRDGELGLTKMRTRTKRRM